MLQNLASTWDQTIYPTLTTYYVKDYGDGRGIAPPDVDNNRQVEVIIYEIDGQYNIGGYFALLRIPRRDGLRGLRGRDPDVVASIIAHERNTCCTTHRPYENPTSTRGTPTWRFTSLWGRQHPDRPRERPDAEQRLLGAMVEPANADYGAGFMLMMYLVITSVAVRPCGNWCKTEPPVGAASSTCHRPANGQAGLVEPPWTKSSRMSRLP